MQQAAMRHTLRLATLGLLVALSNAPALAEKPAHAGGGKPDWVEKKGGGKSGRGDDDVGRREVRREDDGRREIRRDDHREVRRDGDGRGGVSVNIQIGGYFNDAQRRTVVEYYEPRFRAGHCPPGLAKKHNGCMPPGQAKKWRKGYRLPSDVIYYDVPSSVSIRLGTPPAGHKFVRVATDILLIAVGTGMVIDAIEDLGRL